MCHSLVLLSFYSAHTNLQDVQTLQVLSCSSLRYIFRLLCFQFHHLKCKASFCHFKRQLENKWRLTANTYPAKIQEPFPKLIIDYLKQDEKLEPFYKHPVSLNGIKASIEARKQTATPRQLLVDELRKQYNGIPLNDLQEHHLSKLLEENTFTICTAHQPNIFTGHLYFIYKILHTVKLANYLAEQLPGNHFVPVFYMGSEDADLDELGHINLNGEKLEWNTHQTGAVGRMIVDKELIKLIDQLASQLEVHEHGKDLIQIFRKAYSVGTTIQQATLLLVNELFTDYGVLVLIPDNAELKRHFNNVVKKELLEQFSHPLVEETTKQDR